jgi:glycosyltransferase involved in cell wall biosynthesis
MKITVVNALAPFQWGGAEELAHHLVLNLRRSGHDAELFAIPFAWEPFENIPAEMARLKALRLPRADRVISMKFPIYLLDAEYHRTWLFHQYRQAYVLWGTPFTNLPNTPEGLEVREIIVSTDNEALRSRKQLFTISNEISARLLHHNGIEAPALRLPLNDPEIFTGGDYGDYILASGRVNSMKRQWLLVEAMRYMGPKARLVIAGPPETEDERDKLHKLVEQHDLGDRVKLDLRFLDRAELAAYVNNSRAVAYLPYLEDSYGYVTMEAFEAGKPVITTNDAGAVLDIVRNDHTGQVVEPDPRELAKAMSLYLDDKAIAREQGQAGRTFWRSTGINWSDTITRLLGD